MKQFLWMNLIVQIIYFMYIFKLVINQDKYDCIVTNEKDYPQIYTTDA